MCTSSTPRTHRPVMRNGTAGRGMYGGGRAIGRNGNPKPLGRNKALGGANLDVENGVAGTLGGFAITAGKTRNTGSTIKRGRSGGGGGGGGRRGGGGTRTGDTFRYID